jgi:hypothetical protein
LHQEGSHLRFNNRLLAAAVGVAFALPSIDAADATPVNDTFSVTATSGPLAGTTALGTFSYDTSSIVLSGININNGLLTALNFTRHRRAGSARDVEAEVEDRGAVGDPA